MHTWQMTLAWRRFAALNQRQRAHEATKNLARGNVLAIPRQPDLQYDFLVSQAF